MTYRQDQSNPGPSDTTISKVGPVPDSRGVWVEASVTRQEVSATESPCDFGELTVPSFGVQNKVGRVDDSRGVWLVH